MILGSKCKSQRTTGPQHDQVAAEFFTLCKIIIKGRRLFSAFSPRTHEGNEGTTKKGNTHTKKSKGATGPEPLMFKNPSLFIYIYIL